MFRVYIGREQQQSLTDYIKEDEEKKNDNQGDRSLRIYHFILLRITGSVTLVFNVEKNGK
jgi:hypothetical protein